MPSPQLILHCSWTGSTSTLDVHGPIVMGRAAGNGLVIPLEDVSRQHARIEPAADGWRLCDLGSLNGTHLNEARIAEAVMLKPGDVIHIGGATLRVKIRGPVLGLGEDDHGTTVTARPVNEVLGVDSHGETMMGPLPAGNWALSLARDAAEILLEHDHLDGALRALLSQAAEHLPAERGVIALTEPDTGELVPRASFGFTSEPQVSRHVVRQVIDRREAVVIEEVGASGSVAAEQTLMATDVRSVACAPLYHRDTVRGLIYLDRQSTGKRFKPEDLEVLGAVGLFAAIGIEQKQTRDQIEEQERIRTRLERYSSPQVVERIIQPTMQMGMIAEEKVVTVLFADLCGFTALSEGMTPPHVAMLLNSVFDKLTEIVFEFGGTLDKFMGDGMMAFFGAPAAMEGHETMAVAAAWKMRAALAKLNADFRLQSPVRIRYGINSGPVVVGDIGSQQRRDYTVIGDTVNVASRLEGLSQPDQVVVGEPTWEAARAEFDFEPMDPVQVKNRQEPVHPYRVIGPS